jgi:hypothetical protein
LLRPRDDSGLNRQSLDEQRAVPARCGVRWQRFTIGSRRGGVLPDAWGRPKRLQSFRGLFARSPDQSIFILLPWTHAFPMEPHEPSGADSSIQGLISKVVYICWECQPPVHFLSSARGPGWSKRHRGFFTDWTPFRRSRGERYGYLGCEPIKFTAFEPASINLGKCAHVRVVTLPPCTNSRAFQTDFTKADINHFLPCGDALGNASSVCKMRGVPSMA